LAQVFLETIHVLTSQDDKIRKQNSFSSELCWCSSWTLWTKSTSM